jgi:DNA-binding response OmpR family regulator
MPPAKILVVEFDPSLLGTLSLALQSAGFTVVTASSTSEAAERLQSDDFRVVIVRQPISAKNSELLTSLISADKSQLQAKLNS